MNKKFKCAYCGSGVILKVNLEDWSTILYIPWCENDFPELMSKLAPGFTRKAYHEAYCLVRPNDLLRQESLEVELGLAPPCECNNCGRR